MQELDSTCDGSIKILSINQNFLSYSSFWSLYETGAAHGNYWTIGHNYLLNPLRKLDFFNLFNEQIKAIELLRNIVHEKLMLRSKQEFQIEPVEDFYVFDEGLVAEEKNFSNYYFNKTSIVFIFNPYDISGWGLGDHFIEVSFKELLELFPREENLAEFIEIIKI